MRINIKNKIIGLCFIFSLGSLSSCKKYLETKSVQSLSTPQTLDDLQLLVDFPGLGESVNLANTGTDELYIDYNVWNGAPEIYKKGYVWDEQLNDLADWVNLYKTVYYANTILFNLNYIQSNGEEERKANLKGAALFIRSHAFWQLAQLYAPQYDNASAATDLGIVLRLNADFNEYSVRSTVQQTYDQIISDLLEATSLLPNTSLLTRPNRAASYALLARTYLQIGEYAKANEAASNSLKIKSDLIDFNTLSLSAPFPMGDYNNNKEILYYTKTNTGLSAFTIAKADSILYNSYASEDHRKLAFFRSNGNGSYGFKGSYSGSNTLFNGLATDEVYLIRAESFARAGNTDAAIQDLNTLLRNRFDPTFVPLTASNADQALVLILNERKKELLNRGLRWPDLRRLNKDPRFAITLKRDLNGQIFTLPPNDLRYTLLIPLEIRNVAPLTQNPR